MSMHVDTSIKKARIEEALSIAPPHMRPILLAVKDYGVAWASIPQKVGRFDLPKDRPTITLIGDDLHIAMGPAGFHRRSIRRVIAAASVVSIVAGSPEEFAYAAPAGIAILGRNGVIVETRPEFEMQWIGLVKAENPHAQIIIVSVKGTAH